MPTPPNSLSILMLNEFKLFAIDNLPNAYSGLDREKMEQPCCFATIGHPDDRVNVTAMLSILIIPDRATKSDEGPRLEESHPGSQYCFTPSVWKRPRRTGGRVRVRLGRAIEIRPPLPSLTYAPPSDPAN